MSPGWTSERPDTWVTVRTGLDKSAGGGPGGIRTPDSLLRRQVLYPAELRSRADFISHLAAQEQCSRSAQFSAARAMSCHCFCALR